MEKKKRKAPGRPNLFSKNYIYNTPETHTTNRTRYLSALNYEFLVQPTRMEGKNSYCVVKCVINEQCNRWSLSFCRACANSHGNRHPLTQRFIIEQCLVATFGEVNIGICQRFPIKIQYIFLGHNRSYLSVNVGVDVNSKKTDVQSMSPIDPINCFTFDTFLLKICCFAKLDMNRKKRSTATMPFILNREY